MLGNQAKLLAIGEQRALLRLALLQSAVWLVRTFSFLEHSRASRFKVLPCSYGKHAIKKDPLFETAGLVE